MRKTLEQILDVMIIVLVLAITFFAFEEALMPVPTKVCVQMALMYLGIVFVGEVG